MYLVLLGQVPASIFDIALKQQSPVQSRLLDFLVDHSLSAQNSFFAALQ